MRILYIFLCLFYISSLQSAERLIPFDLLKKEISKAKHKQDRFGYWSANWTSEMKSEIVEIEQTKYIKFYYPNYGYVNIEEIAFVNIKHTPWRVWAEIIWKDGSKSKLSGADGFTNAESAKLYCDAFNKAGITMFGKYSNY